MQDPGPPNGDAAFGFTTRNTGASESGALGGVLMHDPPGPQIGGAVPGGSMFDSAALQGGALSAVSLFDPGPSNASAVTGAGGNDDGSASWLMAGTLSGGTSTNADQVVDSGTVTTPVVTADSLQHALKFGT